MNYVFPPAPRVSISVVGTDAVFPVRRVYCIGQNYSDSLVATPSGSRESPYFFSKPVDALVPGGGEVAYPQKTDNYQHEIEFGVAIANGGRDIPVERALDHVFGYAVGFDLTRRDLQAKAKEARQPWEMGKGCDQGAPISAIRPATECGHPASGTIWLNVNGASKQRADLAQMIWKVDEIIASLSEFVALAPGDLIFTGTPAGLSAIKPGDRVEGGIDGVGELAIRLV